MQVAPILCPNALLKPLVYKLKNTLAPILLGGLKTEVKVELLNGEEVQQAGNSDFEVSDITSNPTDVEGNKLKLNIPGVEIHKEVKSSKFELALLHIKLARKGSLLSVRMDHVSKTSIKRLQLVSNFLKDILATKQGV